LFGGSFVFGCGLIDTLLDIARLLAHRAKHLAGVGMETAIAIHVSNLTNGGARLSDEIETRVARDFAGKHDKITFSESFAGHSALRILFETGIEHVIAYRVANFVWMTFGDGLRRKNMAIHGGAVIR